MKKKLKHALTCAGIVIFVLLALGSDATGVASSIATMQSPYTLINRSSHVVSGSVANRAFSVNPGQTITVQGNTWVETIFFRPADLVRKELSGGGFRATFHNR